MITTFFPSPFHTQNNPVREARSNRWCYMPRETNVIVSITVQDYAKLILALEIKLMDTKRITEVLVKDESWLQVKEEEIFWEK